MEKRKWRKDEEGEKIIVLRSNKKMTKNRKSERKKIKEKKKKVRKNKRR